MPPSPMGKALMIAHPVTGCWEWQAVKSNGYPAHQMHRVWWEASNGPVPKGMQLDHLCRNRRCVRPAHMEVVTPKENTRRGNAPTIITARTGVCKRGHVLKGKNVYVYPSGVRSCRICHDAAQKRWNEAHPDKLRAIARQFAAKRRREQPGKVKAAYRKWYAKHGKEYNARRRAAAKAKRDAGHQA